MDSTGIVRKTVPEDLDPLARLWTDGWTEAHLELVPPEILEFRTLATFRARLDPMQPNIRVTGPEGAPTGFCYIEDNEVDQMYVSTAARGTGAAALLLADGEQRLHGRGVGVAWLSCAAGNERAARFYEKNGWASTRAPVAEELNSAPGVRVAVWRYQKSLV